MFHLLMVPGKRILDPATNKLVGSDGVKMESLSTYWYRRVQDGSMVHAPEAKAKVAKADVALKDDKLKTDKE